MIGLTPLQVVTIRLFLTGLFFAPFLFFFYRRIDFTKWKPLLLVGIIGGLVPFTLYAIGMTHVNSAIAGIINSMTPIFTLALGILFFGVPFRKNKTLGVILGLVGTAILVFSKTNDQNATLWVYGLLLVVATLCYAISVNTVKAYLQDLKALDISSSSFGMAAIPCLLYLLIPENTQHILYSESARYSLQFLLVLVIVGTFVGTIIFYRLVQMTSALYASMVSYLMPVVAIFWGLLDGEAFFIVHVVGVLFILSGVYVVQKK